MGIELTFRCDGTECTELESISCDEERLQELGGALRVPSGWVQRRLTDVTNPKPRAAEPPPQGPVADFAGHLEAMANMFPAARAMLQPLQDIPAIVGTKQLLYCARCALRAELPPNPLHDKVRAELAAQPPELRVV